MAHSHCYQIRIHFLFVKVLNGKNKYLLVVLILVLKQSDTLLFYNGQFPFIFGSEDGVHFVVYVTVIWGRTGAIETDEKNSTCVFFSRHQLFPRWCKNMYLYSFGLVILFRYSSHAKAYSCQRLHCDDYS